MEDRINSLETQLKAAIEGINSVGEQCTQIINDICAGLGIVIRRDENGDVACGILQDKTGNLAGMLGKMMMDLNSLKNEFAGRNIVIPKAVPILRSNGK